MPVREDQPIPSHPTPPKNRLKAKRGKGLSEMGWPRFAPLDVSGLGRVQHHHHHRPARGPARIVVGRASVPKNDGADASCYPGSGGAINRRRTMT